MSFEPVLVPKCIEEIENKRPEHIRDAPRYAYGIDEAQGVDKTTISQLNPLKTPFKWTEDNPSTVSAEDEDVLTKENFEKMVEEMEEHKKQRQKDILSIFGLPPKMLPQIKEDDENMEYIHREQALTHDSEVLTLFDVIMVNKEEVNIPGGGKHEKPEVIVDETVLAKTPKQARGKAGIESYLGVNDYDETKFEIKVSVVMPEVKKIKGE